MSDTNSRPHLAHMVFFTLRDNSEDAIERLIASCREFLSGHDGVIFFPAGARAQELDREVNDRDFHVSLHVVFENSVVHDQYQEHPRHLQFIDKSKDNWKSVRVFDSYVC